MGKIVVFGGAFNPPHNLHFLLAEQIVSNYKDIEKIIFMPVNSKYQKKEKILSNEHRYNMLKLVCDENSKFEVSRMEIESERPLYTIETLTKIKEKYPNDEILFLTGTDNLQELETWHEAQTLVDNFKILVLERNEDELEKIIISNEFLNKNKKAFINKKENIRSNLSSTYVRERIRQGQDIQHLLPKSICEYIKENNLYKES